MKNKHKIGHYSEDSSWKAAQIFRMIRRNNLHVTSVGDIGCGVGLIMDELSKKNELKDTKFSGYDIKLDAIRLARSACGNPKITFHHADLLSEINQDQFDLLLVIDVIEHVSDYMGFAEKCKDKARWIIYHIPLDISVASVMRNVYMQGRRRKGGHLHYFTGDSALATLKDTGHEILDYFYTDGAFGLFKQHPSLIRAIANIPRWILSRFSVALTSRLFGGYSIMVLTQKQQE